MGDHFDHARDERAPHDPSPGSVQMPSSPPRRQPPIRTYSGTRVDGVPTPQPQPHHASNGSWSERCSPVHPTATPAIKPAFPLPLSACTIPIRVCRAAPRQAASPAMHNAPFSTTPPAQRPPLASNLGRPRPSLRLARDTWGRKNVGAPREYTTAEHCSMIIYRKQMRFRTQEWPAFHNG
jgi:hypothetical protein